ncbi:MAG: translation elongation factor Ts [Candidatus Latescibacteria bacterium]|nr:translation elongation factor Ts [Candidatus Latescibacterota bacterium]
MKISMELLTSLRARTGSGVLDCKEALEQTNGDIEKAIEYLRKKGIAAAAKKAERATAQGVIDAYIHPGERLGVIVEINCETDFVARNQEFRRFVHDIAMQIAATDPQAISREDIKPEIIETEKKIYEEQMVDSNKPKQVIEKIVQGKLEKYFTDVCLLEQPFVKTPERKVGDYLKEQIAKYGENIRIKRFVRFKLGED